MFSDWSAHCSQEHTEKETGPIRKACRWIPIVSSSAPAEGAEVFSGTGMPRFWKSSVVNPGSTVGME